MRVAIVGTGNIGTDLLEKLIRSPSLEVALFAGIDPASPGLARGREYGIPTTASGVDPLFELDEPVELVFEATSAAVHRQSAPRYEAAGIQAIDLTPAKVGKAIVPSVNIEEADDAPNLNLTTCGGQATVPMVSAISAVAKVEYTEIVSTVASLSAGPGTRQNIDEFTRTTASALEAVGRAAAGKAIIILNPADPPILMRNSVFCIVSGDADREAICASVAEMARCVSGYVPGYRVTAGPEFDQLEDGGTKVSVFLEVTGAGDYLPPYAGNLDIMTAAAVAVADQIAARREVVAK